MRMGRGFPVFATASVAWRVAIQIKGFLYEKDATGRLCYGKWPKWNSLYRCYFELDQASV